MKAMKRRWLGSVCLLAACGAAVPPRVELVMADRWSVLPASASAGGAVHAADFWDRFESPELRSLLDLAAKENLDNLSAAARAAQFEALQRVARAPLYPTLAAAVSGTGQSDNGRNLGSIRGGFFDAGFVAGYGVDLWDERANRAWAADARTEASRDERAAIELSVTAGVAATYFEVLSLRERAQRARENLAVTQLILGVIEAKARAGAALEREVAQQVVLVSVESARVAQIAQAESEARVTLAISVGLEPNALSVQAANLDTVVDPSIDVAEVGMPASLLSRRPDIAQAEAELAACDMDVAAARAALLPQLRIEASASFQSVFLSRDDNGSELVYNAQASLTQPIFDGGALRGERDAAAARRSAAELEYKRRALSAIGEVERALRALTELATQADQARIAVSEAQRAFGLIQIEYETGAEELVSVLDAQRTLFRAQDDLSQLRLARLRAAVALIKALGGGWAKP
jgi:multidrug efflux system outer membrane protein